MPLPQQPCALMASRALPLTFEVLVAVVLTSSVRTLADASGSVTVFLLLGVKLGTAPVIPAWQKAQVRLQLVQPLSEWVLEPTPNVSTFAYRVYREWFLFWPGLINNYLNKLYL